MVFILFKIQESLDEAAKRVKKIFEQYETNFGGKQESIANSFEYNIQGLFYIIVGHYKRLKNKISPPSDKNMTPKQKIERDILCMCDAIDLNFDSQFFFWVFWVLIGLAVLVLFYIGCRSKYGKMVRKEIKKKLPKKLPKKMGSKRNKERKSSESSNEENYLLSYDSSREDEE